MGAGHRASDGKMRILDKVPESLDERTPLIIGNKRDVEEAEAFINWGEKTLSVRQAVSS